MKVIKKIILCSIISLIIQLSGLLYLNNYILATNSDIKSQKIVNLIKKVSTPKINVPNNAENINVSYDGKYIAYYLNDELYVVDTMTGKSNSISFSEGVKVSFYKWLPDRDRMLIAEKKDSKLSLSYYDIDKLQKSNITDFNMINSNFEVKDIEAAPLPNVIYIKVSKGIDTNSIYWVNIMKSTKKINTKTSNIGNIEVMAHEDRMLYEDLTNNKIYVTGMKNALSFIGSKKSCLLEITNDDKIYIGNVDSNNNISNIYFGTLKENTSSWQILKLSVPVNKDNLFVTSSGKIYINNSTKGTVTELETGKETNYKGVFLQSFNDGIASINNGVLVKTFFN